MVGKGGSYIIAKIWLHDHIWAMMSPQSQLSMAATETAAASLLATDVTQPIQLHGQEGGLEPYIIA